MADSFRDAGIADALAGAAAAAGYDRPTPLQAAAAPVIRRGGNVVLHASSGAGVTAAFALPVLDRLLGAAGDAGQPRALVLTPTQERAAAVARAVSQLAGTTGIAVRAAAPGWRTADADVLVLSARRALEAVQTSELKLDALLSVVIVDAAELFGLGDGAALETFIGLIPKDAQRVLTSATLEGAVQTFIDAHVRKALTVPPRPAVTPRDGAGAESLGQIGYMLIEARAKDDTLARLLESVQEDALVYVRNALRAERVREELVARGMSVDVRPFEDAAGSASRVISYDVPFTVEQIRSIHAEGGTVLVTPAERAHFRRLAAEAPFTVKQRRARVMDVGDIETFRAALRTALQNEDLAAQLLVLEPLMEEAAPAEIAAALSALLRRRAPAAVPVSAAAQAATGTAPAQASAGGFTRLFVSVGARDNIRPGDIVGAITGEANIKGDQVGRVDIRESFSVVEVAAPVAERVIRALNGTTMRGRSLRVDFDRKGVSGPQRERGDAPRGPRDRSGPPRRRPPSR